MATMSPTCPDGGTCHHECNDGPCFRVQSSGPLSGTYPGNAWPDDVLAAHGVRDPGFIEHANHCHLQHGLGGPCTCGASVRLPAPSVVATRVVRDFIVQAVGYDAGAGMTLQASELVAALTAAGVLTDVVLTTEQRQKHPYSDGASCAQLAADGTCEHLITQTRMKSAWTTIPTA